MVDGENQGEVIWRIWAKEDKGKQENEFGLKQEEFRVEKSKSRVGEKERRWRF